MITVDEYAAAFRQTLPDLNEKKREMLQELLHAPEHTLSGEVLAKKLGYEHYVAANGLLGNIGKAIYEHVGRHPDGFAAGTFQPWTVIAQEGRNRAQGYPWQLRPNVVAALLGSGYFEAVRHPEELSESDSQTFAEGAVQIRYVNGFERSAAAREKCLAIYGYRCSCCDIDMAKMYNLKQNYVQVHHLNPLAAQKQEYQVDPVQDLRPVCPNCHAVIHLSEPILKVEAVRQLLGKS